MSRSSCTAATACPPSRGTAPSSSWPRTLATRLKRFRHSTPPWPAAFPSSRRPPVVAWTAGGALAERAAAHGLPRAAVPGGLMPRMALGYMFLPAVALLADAGVTVAAPDDVDEAIGAVDALAQQLAPEQPATTNE